MSSEKWFMDMHFSLISPPLLSLQKHRNTPKVFQFVCKVLVLFLCSKNLYFRPLILKLFFYYFELYVWWLIMNWNDFGNATVHCGSFKVSLYNMKWQLERQKYKYSSNMVNSIKILIYTNECWHFWPCNRHFTSYHFTLMRIYCFQNVL